jgi:DNA adenine methylase
MKAPFGRMGGKSKLANQLIKLFPKDYDVFIEPFVGAGNILFRKPVIEGQQEIINDLDKDVIRIMNGLKTRNAYIQNNIPRRITKAYFDKIKNKRDVINTLVKAKASFYNIGLSFKGNDKTIVNIKTDFTPYKDRLKNVTILNESFAKVIKEYDSNNSFFFLDPPYESDERKDYKDYVTPEQVFQSVKNIKGKFMLTYNDSTNIRQLFKSFKIKTIDTMYEPNGNTQDKRKVTELIIMNY